MWTDAWPSLPITNSTRSLDELVQLVERPPIGQADDIARALSSLLVVRSSGYLEQVVIECVRSYTVSKSAQRVSSYSVSWISKGLNPAPDKLVALVDRFDGEWATELRALLDQEDQRLRRELSFMVDRRNKVAHGLSQGIGARKAIDLAGNAQHAAKWFICRFDPR